MWYNIRMDAFKSATKIVLLLMVLTLCVGMFRGVIDSKDFNNALLMVLAFYFGGKSGSSTPTQG